MGIVVGLQETLYGASEYRNNFHTAGIYQEYTQKFADGSENGHNVSDFSWTTGTLTPVISVGTALPLGGWELKPRLDLGFGFNFGNAYSPTDRYTGTGSYVYEDYRSVNGVETARTKTEYTADRLVLNPKFSLGADLDFAPDTGPSLAVGGGFNLHGEDFGATEKTTTYFYQGNTNRTHVDEAKSEAYAEFSEYQFFITPAYRYALSLGDRVDLGLKGGLEVEIYNFLSKPDNSSVTTDIYSYPNPAGNYTQITKWYDGGTQQEQSQWGITPQAVAAIQFNAIPNRLTLNAGVSLYLPGFTTTTTKATPLQSRQVTETERADGSREEFVSYTNLSGASTSETENGWSPFGWGFGAGFSFLFNETFAADLAFNTGSANFNVNLNNVAVLFTVRR